MSDKLTYALEMISGTIDGTAEAIHKLGAEDAYGSMGALGLLSLELRNGTENMAEAIRELAAAVREGGSCRCK